MINIEPAGEAAADYSPSRNSAPRRRDGGGRGDGERRPRRDDGAPRRREGGRGDGERRARSGGGERFANGERPPRVDRSNSAPRGDKKPASAANKDKGKPKRPKV